MTAVKPCCYNCSDYFEPGTGYVTDDEADELFCSDLCAEQFRAALGA